MRLILRCILIILICFILFVSPLRELFPSEMAPEACSGCRGLRAPQYLNRILRFLPALTREDTSLSFFFEKIQTHRGEKSIFFPRKPFFKVDARSCFFERHKKPTFCDRALKILQLVSLMFPPPVPLLPQIFRVMKKGIHGGGNASKTPALEIHPTLFRGNKRTDRLLARSARTATKTRKAGIFGMPKIGLKPSAGGR